MSRPFRLEDIIKPPPTQWYSPPRDPVYQKKYYIDDLRRNYRELGLDEKRVDEIDKKIPESSLVYSKTESEKINFDYIDKLVLKLNVVADEIKVEIDSSMYDMYEYYVSKSLVPPLELQIKAFKSVGASDIFIENMIKKYENKKKIENEIDLMIEKVFEKEQKKKAQKKKEKEIIEEVEEEEVNDDDEEEDDDIGTEEDALVDEDAEDDDDQVQEDEEVELDDE
jgi:hypothetical protein